MLMSFFVQTEAQSNLRYKTINITSDTLHLDTMSVVPGTLTIRGAAETILDTADYDFFPYQSLLIWKKKPEADEVKLFYRVYPFNLSAERYNKSNLAYRDYSQGMIARPFVYKPDEARTNLIDFGGLDYNGSFSRSVAFGSNQSVVLNSLFNLQLSGMLTKDLEVTAAITDNNIPIQPEGNTQQIQEFDRIFIQLRKDQHKVIVGDFDLFNPTNDYFMRFSKKYQGGSYTGAFDFKKAGKFRTGVAGGISRGKFARNTLAVSEGNQGPYKLLGANGETFIVLLANTEEVFVNGQKMERGADRDYVIDYNLGEIRFMPRRIITKDLRVIVEFEYTERNYLRTTAFLNTEYEIKNALIYFNVYSEQDSKGQNVQQDLNADKKLFLSTIGDSIQNAFYRGYDSVAFDANRILYEIVDTVAGVGFFDSVFVYSTNSEAAKYALTFALVGPGKGNYVPASSTANGRVYDWVAPVWNADSSAYIPQGTYEPLIFLVTPKYQQLYTLGTSYAINERHSIKADVSVSNSDVNMYSKRDNQDNAGLASRLAYKGSVLTKSDSVAKHKQQLDIDFNYEFLQDRYTTIERYRNIEFNRDWNIQNSLQRFNEHLATLNLNYGWSGLGNIGYRFKTFVQGNTYRGFENGLTGNFAKNNWRLTFQNSYLNSSSLVDKTNYIRPKADFTYSFPKIRNWKLGAMFDHEVNQIKALNVDTLDRRSFLWQNYKVYFGSSDTAVNKFGIEYTMRFEHRPLGNSFDKPFFGAQTVNFNGQVNSLKNQVLNYSLTYRHVEDADSLNSQQPEHFYLGRIDYNLTLLRGFLRSTTLYELGSGREQKTQLTYQASPTNQGDFIWKDLNGNGRKELDEFVVSQFVEDTSYLRVYVVTPEFIAVNSTQFNQVFNINPAAIWRNKTGVRKVLSMFSLLASVQISKKTYATRSKKVRDYFNPIPLKGEDEQLVATSFNSRNSLYFNRLEAKYGAQVDVNYSRNRVLLTTGFENRLTQSQGITARWNIYKALNFQTTYTNGVKSNESDFYKAARFRFSYNEVLTDWSYQFKTNLRITAKYDFSLKVNPTDTVGKQTVQVHRATAQVRYNRLAKTTIEGTFSYASIAYKDKGFANQQLQFAMLEGLQNGNNLVWNLGLEQVLTNNIQLSITYEGRMTGFEAGKKETLQPIHTGRAEIRALF
jgi:hypothetical protein